MEGQAEALDNLPYRGTSTSTLWRLHHSYLKSGQPDEAARVLSRIGVQERQLTAHAIALELCESPEAKADCLVNLAASYVDLGIYEEASRRLRDADAICEREGLAALHVRVLMQRAKLSSVMSDADQARELAEEALDVAEDIGDHEVIRSVHSSEGDIEDVLEGHSDDQ